MKRADAPFKSLGSKTTSIQKNYGGDDTLNTYKVDPPRLDLSKGRPDNGTRSARQMVHSSNSRQT
jgi:hypothetical protein